MTHIALWLLVVESLSWAAFLLLQPLARTWPDRGFGASKAAGVLMVGLGTWLLAWYGVASPSAGLAWVVAGALGVAALWRLGRCRRTADWPDPAELAAGESLWLVTLSAFLLLRAANPALAGGEKFMDSAFFAASIRATTMPPVDPWFAGAGINYYFFGYWTWAQPARMLGAPPEIAYNLAMATLPAQVASCAYSVGRLLTPRRVPALVAAVGLVWSGTWAGAAAIPTLGPSYDYWTPTRAIPGTINEFPFFSFFWGDLHPHVMAMPNFLLSVGLCLAWLARGRPRTGAASAATDTAGLAPFAGAAGLTLGMAVTTSVWELAGIGLVATGVLASILPSRGVLTTTGLALVMGASAAVVALPPALSMETGSVSLGLATTHSPWGAWLRVQGGWLLPIAAGAAVAAARRRWSERPVWVLLAVAAVLLAVAETVFVDDVYGRGFERMNVVFKLHLQAMLLFGLAWAWAFDEIFRRGSDRVPAGGGLRATVAAARLAVAASALALAVYPVGALASRWSAAPRPLSLDGTAYLALTHPDDRAIVLFAAREIAGQPVIAEAPGNQYGYAGRVSALTGLPAVLGWAGHERLWRRTAAAGQEIDERARMVQRLYEGDPAEAARVIARYGIRYIVLGDAERQAYPALKVSTLDRISRVRFASGQARVYEVSR